MADEPKKEAQGGTSDDIEPDFRRLDFPSDALSVKRFRHLFPDHFDCSDIIVNGYSNNDFFFPAGTEEPIHLVRLHEMICDERVVAAGAYAASFLDRFPDILAAEDRNVIRRSQKATGRTLPVFQASGRPGSCSALDSPDRGRCQRTGTWRPAKVPLNRTLLGRRNTYRATRIAELHYFLSPQILWSSVLSCRQSVH